MVRELNHRYRQLKERVQDLENKVGLLESNAMANESSSNGGVDSQEVAELKKTIEMHRPNADRHGGTAAAD